MQVNVQKVSKNKKKKKINSIFLTLNRILILTNAEISREFKIFNLGLIILLIPTLGYQVKQQPTDNQTFGGTTVIWKSQLCMAISCVCLRAMTFPLFSLLVLYARHSSNNQHFDVSSMTRTGPISNPTPPRQQAVTLPFTLKPRNYQK